MEKEIKRFAVIQMGKVLAVLYTFVAMIMLPFIFFGMASSPRGAPGAIPMIIVVVLYPVLGFVVGIIIAALYNLTAKWVGGLRFTVEQSEENFEQSAGGDA